MVVQRAGRPLRPEPAVRPAPRPVRHPLRHPRQRRPGRGPRRSGSSGVERALGPGPDAVDRAHTIGLWLGFEIGDSPRARRRRPRPAEASANGRRRTSASTSGAWPIRRRWCCFSRTCTGRTRRCSALIDAADAVLRDSRVLVVATTRPTPARTPPALGRGPRLPHPHCRSSRCRGARPAGCWPRSCKRADQRPAGAQRPRRDGVGGQPVLRRGAGEVVPRGRRHHQGRRTRWHVLDERLEQAEVPATLRSVLQARLDALSPAERLALQRASVIGRVFWDDAVESLAEATGDDRRADRRADRRGARPAARPRGRVPAGAVGVRRTPGSSCSSTPCCATSPTRGCCGGTVSTYHGLAARWFEQMAERTRRGGRVRRPHRRPPRQRAATARRPPAGTWWPDGRRRRSTGSPTPRRLLDGRASTLVPDVVPRSLRFDLLLAREIGARPDRRPRRRSRSTSRRSHRSNRRRRDRSRPGAIRLLLTQCRWTFHHSEYAAEDAAAQEAIELAARSGPRRPRERRPGCGWARA